PRDGLPWNLTSPSTSGNLRRSRTFAASSTVAGSRSLSSSAGAADAGFSPPFCPGAVLSFVAAAGFAFRASDAFSRPHLPTADDTTATTSVRRIIRLLQSLLTGAAPTLAYSYGLERKSGGG